MLIQRLKGCAPKIEADRPIVGSKWKGKPETHYDTQAGTYWEVMPTLSAGEVLLQRALLNKVVDIVPLMSYIETFKLMTALDESLDKCEKTVSIATRYKNGIEGKQAQPVYQPVN